ncbi:hypothetical protein FB561_5860 [Kribbella amoyensis]|uniref:Transcriptional regulator n=1 Tax=Kribbella amoyensis TaxID=996641 RepID=A0A561C0H5_9ACTN|nr:transcriptional regulator [Kribbella amoyensis]TWD84666.1 hypothetical protein FB561_5860 [Kribbella amoyensis]
MPSAHEEVTVGVVGGEQIVHRTMALARELDNPSLRLVAAVYADEHDAHTQASRIMSRVDVMLFAGPLPYDRAVAAGRIPVPATYVPAGGPALPTTLLRGVLEDVFDPRKISVDTISRRELQHAYEEIGLKVSGVRVQEYAGPESAEKFLDFHRKLYEQGKTTGAVTTVPSVEAALRKAGIPTLRMTPAATTIRTALTTAILMGSGAKLEESRIVTMIVRVPGSALPAHASPSNYWYQELKLSLHRELLRDARPMDAAVIPRDEHSFLVVTTMGSLRLATDNLSMAPFLGRVHKELGILLEIGIGLGRSTREAEVNAQSAVDKAAADGGRTAFIIGPRDTVLQLPADRSHRPERSASTPESKGAQVLALLAERLDETGDTERVVDAEKVAELLEVTLRTARRSLRTLVDEGLAWPMPPSHSSKVGRPPRPYQLLVEKLPR